MKAQSVSTRVVQGDVAIRSAILELFVRARTRLDMCSAELGGGQSDNSEEFIEALLVAKRRGVRARMVTEITEKTLPLVRLAEEFIEVRHVQGLKGNFAVSDSEYLSSPTVGESLQSLPVVYSNSPALVEQHQFIFEKFWSQGVSLEERAHEIETGTAVASTELLREPSKIMGVFLRLVETSKNEVLLMLPSPGAFRRAERAGMVEALESAADRGVKVRLLTPVDTSTSARLARSRTKGRERTFTFREVLSAETTETVIVLIVDRTSALGIEERDPNTRDFEKAVGLAGLSTNDPRVKTNVRLFERFWRETERREEEERIANRERRSRLRAELMQDILTHDIRNFNQVSRLNAELINERVTDPEVRKRVSIILRAIDGSSRLIDTTKRLGSIIAQESVRLRPVSLHESFDRSMSLVRKSNPGVDLTASSKLKGKVMADGLLDEVFTNLVSNSVKYTDAKAVALSLSQSADDLRVGTPSRLKHYWRIGISDRGRGIPDELKQNLFTRYLETSGGSGLGLSIVYALVVERYSGKVRLSDRVKGDHKGGTRVEIWLPRA